MQSDLNSKVMLYGGLREERARPVILSVLTALRRQLGSPEAEALADELPAELATALRHGSYAGGDDLVASVAAIEQVSAAEAVEHVACVGRALAELLPTDLLARLRRTLPVHSAKLLEPSAPATDEVYAHPGRATLAEGRPGSRHPLSEARPSTAQADSLVVSDDPHADTKLSSSRGLTQERERESIAVGRPGARRSLADPTRER